MILLISIKKWPSGRRTFATVEPSHWTIARRTVVSSHRTSPGLGIRDPGALYLWSLAFYYDLIFAIFIPAFHSLQYLLFSWRYQLNKVSSEAGPGTPAPAETISRPALVRFAKFVGWGLVLGWIGFTGLPLLFHASLSPDPALFGPAVFVFIFVMWINIHHYFIDNVIWRRDNEDVRKYLFAPR